MSESKLQKEFRFFYAEGLSKAYGGLQAVDNFRIELNAGEIVGLIGPNGAGKTTVFNLITGLDTPDAGEVYFQRDFIHSLPAHRIAHRGIARTFQNIRLLSHLTVLDNVKIAYHNHIRYTLAEAALRLPRFFAVERDITEKAMAFLELFDLADWAKELAGGLPYGQRRKLEMARALATEAELLLLDEPAAGLNPTETAELTTLIRRLRDEFKVTILLIEHDMKLVMSLCDRLEVLNFGQVIASGTPEEVQTNPDVIAAYLGAKREDEPC
ncbi:MAG: ABC transporter ATP-binding protein [Planctomycetota bacterium]|jgi:branched-chain amino acid transport system ATP-binding protein